MIGCLFMLLDTLRRCRVDSIAFVVVVSIYWWASVTVSLTAVLNVMTLSSGVADIGAAG